MKITIETIPHKDQRYPTAGDWQFIEMPELSDTDLEVKVSKLNDECMEFLVGIHEAVEAFLCHQNLIKDEDVCMWDKEHLDHPDPGSIPGAPYYREHMIATMIERVLASELGVDWDVYEERIESL